MLPCYASQIYLKVQVQRPVRYARLKGRLAAQACIKKIKVKIKTVFQGKNLFKQLTVS
jgi:hypothetical protein